MQIAATLPANSYEHCLLDLLEDPTRIIIVTIDVSISLVKRRSTSKSLSVLQFSTQT